MAEGAWQHGYKVYLETRQAAKAMRGPGGAPGLGKPRNHVAASAYLGSGRDFSIPRTRLIQGNGLLRHFRLQRKHHRHRPRMVHRIPQREQDMQREPMPLATRIRHQDPPVHRNQYRSIRQSIRKKEGPPTGGSRRTYRTNRKTPKSVFSEPSLTQMSQSEPKGGKRRISASPISSAIYFHLNPKKNIEKFTFSDLRGYPEDRGPPSRLPQGSYKY